MNKYVLITDTTADLPNDVLKDLGVVSIPMEFILDDKTYNHYSDCRELSLDKFYQALKEGKKSKTSQINFFTYDRIFRPYLEQGYDILYICFTSGLSGTYSASLLAIEELKQEFPDRRIVSVDSLCASIGEGLLVHNAGVLYHNQASFDDVLNYILEYRLKVCHWFVVDDLETVRQGGRITALQAAFGGMLNIKPLLSVNDEGKLVPVAKLRGKKRILQTFIDVLLRDSNEHSNQTVVVGHANNLEVALGIKEELLRQNLVKDVIITDIGPVIGTHVGPGMVALTFVGTRNLQKI